jgi:acyl-CoA dehydrogenase
LDFDLSQDEKLFKESVHEFLSKELNPIWIKMDSEKKIPTEVIHKMGDQGLFAIAVPEEYGGQGGSFLLAALAVEEVAYNDPAVATAVFTLLNNSWPYILYLYGKEETKQEILPLVGKGRGFFGIAST